MLGKVPIVFLVAASACLVRPEGREGGARWAGATGELARLLSKWGAKSSDDLLTIMAKGKNLHEEDYIYLHEVLLAKGPHSVALIAAFKKPVVDEIAKIKPLLAEYDKVMATNPNIRWLVLEKLPPAVDEYRAAIARYNTHLSNLKRVAGWRGQRDGTLSKILVDLQVDIPAREVARMTEIEEVASLITKKLDNKYYLVEKESIVPYFVRLSGSRKDIHKAHVNILKAHAGAGNPLLIKKLIDEARYELAMVEVFRTGDLQKEVYPAYNAFLYNTFSFMQELIPKNIEDGLSGTVVNSNHIARDLGEVAKQLTRRNDLLERVGDSARQARIKGGSVLELDLRKMDASGNKGRGPVLSFKEWGELIEEKLETLKKTGASFSYNQEEMIKESLAIIKKY